ncbi:hypothetical protein ACLOJK_035401 [Asimina triloba]
MGNIHGDTLLECSSFNAQEIPKLFKGFSSNLNPSVFSEAIEACSCGDCGIPKDPSHPVEGLSKSAEDVCADGGCNQLAIA